MIVDGRAIAADIREKLARIAKGFLVPPKLAIVVVGEDAVIESFVRIKKTIGAALGITVVEYRFAASVVEEELLRTVKELARDETIDGIIIQLPLPASITIRAVLDAVPMSKDVDMLSTESVAAFRRGDAPCLPPVAGAIQEILERSKVNVAGKEALVLGYGRLVGVPASLLLRHNGAHVTVIDQEISDLAEHTRESDLIVCGVGKSGMLQPEMLKQGVVIIDAGTSESGGKIVGDAQPECAEVTSVFTPVPGGVGPVAVALIFKNLLVLKAVLLK